MSDTALTIVPRQDGGAIVSTQELRAALQQAKEQQELIGEFVRSIMKEGIDYGTIPGTERTDPKSGEKIPNPTLYKPGAEKLIAFFRCHPRFRVRRNEDPASGLYAYEFRCEILSAAGDVVAEGFGSASSKESKYRWRTAQRVCPKCKQPGIRASNKEPGYYCWAKIGGCAAKFPPGDPAIEGQKLGRIENPDAADVANTVLKMAKKRSMVDAALALGRCSDLFGQDLEDMVDLPPPEPPKAAAPKAVAKPAAAAKPAEHVDQNTGEITENPFGDPGKPTPFEVLLDRIENAHTLAVLMPMAAECKTRPDSELPELRAAFTKRKAELEAPPPEPGSGG